MNLIKSFATSLLIFVTKNHKSNGKMNRCLNGMSQYNNNNNNNIVIQWYAHTQRVDGFRLTVGYRVMCYMDIQ